jgi:hypothetical protein
VFYICTGGLIRSLIAAPIPYIGVADPAHSLSVHRNPYICTGVSVFDSTTATLIPYIGVGVPVFDLFIPKLAPYIGVVVLVAIVLPT